MTYQSTRRRVRSSCSSRMVMDITHAGCCAANVLPKSRTEFTFFINKLCQNPEKVLKMYLNWKKRKAHLACEGGRANAMEWIPPSLGFLCNFVSAVKATPVERKLLV